MMPRNRLAIWTLMLWAWVVPLNALAATTAASPSDRLWRQAALEQAALDQRGAVLHDETLADYLRNIADRLWARLHSEIEPPTINVVVDARMEAFAYPNASIYVTTGMLNQIENESQLAMILAHEMVHYVRQHTVALYERLQNTDPDSNRSPVQRSGFTGEYAVAPEIDAAEAQADEEGLFLLRAAGYCDAEVIALLQNLLKSTRSLGLAETAGAVNQRLGRIRQLLNNIPDGSACLTAADTKDTFYLKKMAPAFIADAQAAIQSGDWIQADMAISKYMAWMPDDALAFYIKGEILRRHGDGNSQDQCVGFYEKALEVDPQFPLAHRALGELYFKAGQYQLAKPHFEAFLSLAPQDDASAYIKGYMRLCQ